MMRLPVRFSNAVAIGEMGFTCTTQIFLLLFPLFLSPQTTAGKTAFYADNGLQQTVLVEKVPGRQKREMQQEILTLLGLHHRPKPKDINIKNSAPKFMIDLYKSLNVDGKPVNVSRFGLIGSRSIEGSDIIMSFINHAEKIHHLRHEKQKTFFFVFSEVSPGEAVTGAVLRIYKERKNDLRHQRLRLEVFRICQGPDPEDRTLESESNVTLSGEDEGWFDLNVTSAASAWVTNPDTNLGLYIQVKDLHGRELNPKVAGLVGRDASPDKQSFMVSYFRVSHEAHLRRTRAVKPRRIPETTYNDQPYFPHITNPYHHQICQRKSLTVRFAELGFQGWIISPDSFSSFYCEGECPFPLVAHMNATNHALIQMLVHLVEPSLAPKLCCAPTKLSPISILYFDEQSNVILKQFQDMVVNGCGCH